MSILRLVAAAAAKQLLARASFCDAADACGKPIAKWSFPSNIDKRSDDKNFQEETHGGVSSQKITKETKAQSRTKESSLTLFRFV